MRRGREEDNEEQSEEHRHRTISASECNLISLNSLISPQRGRAATADEVSQRWGEEKRDKISIADRKVYRQLFPPQWREKRGWRGRWGGPEDGITAACNQKIQALLLINRDCVLEAKLARFCVWGFEFVGLASVRCELVLGFGFSLWVWLEEERFGSSEAVAIEDANKDDEQCPAETAVAGHNLQSIAEAAANMWRMLMARHKPRHRAKCVRSSKKASHRF